MISRGITVPFTLFALLLVVNGAFTDGPCYADSCSNGGTCHRGPENTHWCRCPEGYSGDHCGNSKCYFSCLNDGVCTMNANGTFGCRCPYGHSGPSCEIKRPSCIGRSCKCNNYCKNGGVCSLNDRGLPECRCDDYFTGDKCEAQKFDCSKLNVCENGGRCDFQLGHGFFCNCTDDFKGKYCEQMRDAFDCTSEGENSCRNGGFCSQTEESSSTKCVCPPNFEGIFCENDVNECDMFSPCKNGGTCVNTKGGFQCYCSISWEGETCTINKDDCASNPCAPGSVCKDGIGGFKCICPPGKTGELCAVNDQCASNPCRHGTCASDPVTGDYQCLCEHGFTGENCDRDINECNNRGVCKNNGRCMNTAGSFYCECPKGFTGPLCETSIDFCKEKPCLNHGTCSNSNGWKCLCVPGFAGSLCEIRCPTGFFGHNCESAVGDSEPCKEGECKNGGNCSSGHCVCQDEFFGSRCERSPCDNVTCAIGQKCKADKKKTSGYSCVCPPGMQGLGCIVEIDECAMNPCQHGGSCTDLLNDYQCECPNGYIGKNCEQPVNHCADSPCSNGGLCINEADGYLCACGDAFYGARCQLTRDPCQRHRCDNGGECVPSPNYRNYTCKCKEEYEGQFCDLDVNECLRSPCRHDGKCQNTNGSYACVCPEGYTGKNCEVNIDDCANNHCLNNGTCEDLIAGFQCHCSTGFTGKRCAVNIDDCDPDPCQNGGSCRDKVNSYECRCPPGFSGRHCQINDDDCRPGLCLHGICKDKINDYKCECDRGYTGKNCAKYVDVDIFNKTDRLQAEQCKRAGCDAKAADGHCDHECKFYACGFDGGDCSAQNNPYERCSIPSYCYHVSRDGKCDEICNTEECLYDGYDCEHSHAQRCPASIRQRCRDHFQDGHCDPMCNRADCGWDGGDCESTKNKLDGEIEMILLMNAEIFWARRREFLTILSKELRTTVTIAEDDQGARIYSWDNVKGKGNRVLDEIGNAHGSNYYPSPPSSANSEDTLNGVLFYIQVDNTHCTHNCFSQISAVANFIGARMAKEDLHHIGMNIHSAIVRTKIDDPTSSSFSTRFWYICSACVFVVVVVAVLQSRKRNREQLGHPVWNPPTEEECKKKYQEQQDSFYSRADSDFSLNFAASSAHLGLLLEKRYDIIPRIEIKPKKRRIFPAQSLLQVEAESEQPIQTPIDESLVNETGPFGYTALMYLANNKDKSPDIVVQDAILLLNHGAVINARDEDGATALFMAVKNGKFSLSKLLLERGADASITNKEESMCIHEAAKINDLELVSLLLQYEEVKTNLDYCDNKNRTPLMITAKEEEETSIAELLVEHRADVNFAGDKAANYYTGRTALHFAAHYNNTKLIEFLCEQDANKDAQDREDRTPLFLAVCEGHIDAVTLLLDKGASPEFTDQDDHTPLTIALKREYHDIAKLIEARAMSKPVPSVMNPLSLGGGKMTARQKKEKKDIAKKRRQQALTPPTSDGSHYSTTPSPHDSNYPIRNGGVGSVMDSPPSEGAQPMTMLTPPSISQAAGNGWIQNPPNMLSPPYDYTDIHQPYYMQSHSFYGEHCQYARQQQQQQQQQPYFPQ